MSERVSLLSPGESSGGVTSGDCLGVGPLDNRRWRRTSMGDGVPSATDIRRGEDGYQPAPMDRKRVARREVRRNAGCPVRQPGTGHPGRAASRLLVTPDPEPPRIEVNGSIRRSSHGWSKSQGRGTARPWRRCPDRSAHTEQAAPRPGRESSAAHGLLPSLWCAAPTNGACALSDASPGASEPTARFCHAPCSPLPGFIICDDGGGAGHSAYYIGLGSFAMFTHRLHVPVIRSGGSGGDRHLLRVAGVGSAAWWTSATCRPVDVGWPTPSVARHRGWSPNYADPSISQPDAITAGPDGALWFTNWNYSSVERITTAGVMTNYPDPNAGGPWAITVGRTGPYGSPTWATTRSARSPPTGWRPTTPGPSPAFRHHRRARRGPVVHQRRQQPHRADHHRRSGHRLSSGATIDEPYRITAGPDGALWFTNDGNNSIGRITTAGVVTNFYRSRHLRARRHHRGPRRGPVVHQCRQQLDRAHHHRRGGHNYTDPTIDGPDGITAGPDGALWFTNGGNDSIGRITTAGEVTNYTGDGIYAPDGIAAGPDGALWFTNYGNNSIGRITTGPSLLPRPSPSLPHPRPTQWSVAFPTMSPPPVGDRATRSP